MTPRTEETAQSPLATGRSVLPAAAPPALYGLCIGAITLLLIAVAGPSGITRLAAGFYWHYGAVLVAGLAIVVLAAAAVAAVRRRLPVWSYTWVAALAAGVLIALNLVIEDRAVVLTPAVDVGALVIFGVAGVLTFGTTLARGWRHSGLYSLGISATLGLSLCFFGVAGLFDPGLGALAVLAGLAQAGLVYAYVIGGDGSRLATLVGAAIVSAALAWRVEALFRVVYPARDMSQFWLLVGLLIMPLILGPLFGSAATTVRTRLSRRAD